MSLSTFHCC